MPDEKNNLFIYEAIELRQEYDKHIKVLENLLKKVRKLNHEIHRINHTEAVNFKDEPL